MALLLLSRKVKDGDNELKIGESGVMNGQWKTMDCKLVLDPEQPDRFYMDMRVYQIVKPGTMRAVAGNSEVWRGLYLAVEVKPWMDTGHQIKAG